MNANKRYGKIAKLSLNMNCNASVLTCDDATKETKVVLQQALQNMQVDMECTKKCMEFGKIMLSYSCDKMKCLESQIRQMKSVIDANSPLKQSFSDDELAFQDGASILSEGTPIKNASDNIDDRDNNVLQVDSSQNQSKGGHRRKKLKTISENKDRSTQTPASNIHADSSQTRTVGEQTSGRSFNIPEAASIEKTSHCTTSGDVVISDDFIAIDSPEKGTCGNRKKGLGLNTGTTKNVSTAQKMCFNLYADSSETEVVDLDVEQTASPVVNLTDEVDDTDTEAARMAVQRTMGILPSQNLLTFLLLSRQVDDPVQLAQAFTKDIKMFYFQLVTFAFHLQDINATLAQREGVSQVDRRLEERLQILINVFQAEFQPESE